MWADARQLAIYKTVEHGGQGDPKTFRSGQSLLVNLPSGDRVKPHSAHVQTKWLRHDQILGKVISDSVSMR